MLLSYFWGSVLCRGRRSFSCSTAVLFNLLGPDSLLWTPIFMLLVAMQKVTKEYKLMTYEWHGGHKRMVCVTGSYKQSFPNSVLVGRTTPHESTKGRGLPTGFFLLGLI